MDEGVPVRLGGRIKLADEFDLCLGGAALGGGLTGAVLDLTGARWNLVEGSAVLGR